MNRMGRAALGGVWLAAFMASAVAHADDLQGEGTSPAKAAPAQVASVAPNVQVEDPSQAPVPAPRSESSSSSVVVSTTTSINGDPRRIDEAPAATRQASDSLTTARLLHGFRIGYGTVLNSEKHVESFGGQSLAEKTGMRNPNQFLIGYEAFYRMVGHSWLNVILVGNAMVGGLEQSKFFPSANGLIGFEFNNSFQAGVGVNLTPLAGSEAHTIFAAGWTPRVGTFYVPLHAFFIPDVDGVHRLGMTTGVTW